MASWTPSQAGAYKAEAAGLYYERLAASKQARRGLHRFLGIARSHGYAEVVVPGGKLTSGIPSQQEYSPGHAATGQQGGESAREQRSKPPRNRTAARKSKEKGKLDAKWEKRREAEADIAAAAAAPAAGELPATPEEAPPRERPLDELMSLPQLELSSVLGKELSRIANATRTDVTQLLAESTKVENDYALRVRASGRTVERSELMLFNLEWLWSFEDDWHEHSAPESHMEPEWGGAPT